MTAIVNPLSQYPIDWDWAEHLANRDKYGRRYQGGTDYMVPRGTAIKSPASGRFLYLSSSSCGVMVNDEISVIFLELASVSRLTGSIARGATLGLAGGKYVHVHALRNGHRIPFESVVSGTAGTGASPAPTTPSAELFTPEDPDMKLLPLYISDSVDGNNYPGWMLLNLDTLKPLVKKNDGSLAAQKVADGWARTWGDFRPCNRQDYLNALDALKKTA